MLNIKGEDFVLVNDVLSIVKSSKRSLTEIFDRNNLKGELLELLPPGNAIVNNVSVPCRNYRVSIKALSAEDKAAIEKAALEAKLLKEKEEAAALTAAKLAAAKAPPPPPKA